MTPAERLNSIEKSWADSINKSGNLVNAHDVGYLINRVRQLTKAMETVLQKMALDTSDTADVLIKSLIND